MPFRGTTAPHTPPTFSSKTFESDAKYHKSMNVFLRALRLLAIVIWVGGLIFFAFVEAPTAVHVMGTTQQFAQLINSSITTLNRLGQSCGLVFFIATIVIRLRTDTHSRKLLRAELFLVLLMMAATDYVQSSIVPAMERDRSAAGGDIASVPTTNPTRNDFDRLHALSEQVEGSALLLGLAVVMLMAAEQPRTEFRADQRQNNAKQ